MRKQWIASIAAGSGLCLCAGTSVMAQQYPAEPVRTTMAAAPGLTETLDRAAVIDEHPGGGGIIACEATARVHNNSVAADERGLIHLLDRVRGLHILERT